MSKKVIPNRSPWPDQPLFIVDDDVQWLTMLTQALRSLGWYRVRTLSDPSFAMQLAGEFRPAVVLLDLMMTEKNGHQVLKEMRADQPDLPIIVVTGIDEVNQAVACMQAGASDYLTKPLSRERLEQALRQAVLEQETETHDEDSADFQEVLHELGELPNIKEVPDMLIEEAMRRSGGVVKDAAAMLGISAQAICNRRRRARDAS